MKKNDLILKVSEKLNIKKKDATKIIDATFDTIIEALAEGEKVSVSGFGIFSTRHRAERIGKKPQTGEPVKVPAATVPSFKASKSLKEAVNK